MYRAVAATTAATSYAAAAASAAAATYAAFNHADDAVIDDVDGAMNLGRLESTT